MKNLILLPLLIVSTIAFAEADKKLDVKSEIAKIEASEQVCLDSDEGQSTMGMKMCVFSAGEEFDVLLNKVYSSVISGLKAKSTDDYVTEYNSEALKRLVKSERAWLKFRDADSVLNGLTSFGGTMEGLDIGESANEMTKVRILQISQLFAE